MIEVVIAVAVVVAVEVVVEAVLVVVVMVAAAVEVVVAVGTVVDVCRNSTYTYGFSTIPIASSHKLHTMSAVWSM